MQSSMVVHTYNSSTHKVEARGLEFQASMGYNVRLCLKKKTTKKIGTRMKGVTQ
jgi:hypothetical protein